MALATRCPYCSAIFRVGAEQLTLRGGIVRCGSCRHVFNAIGHLDYVEPTASNAEEPAPRAPGPAAVDVTGEHRRNLAQPPATASARPAARRPAQPAQATPAGQAKAAAPSLRPGAAAPSAVESAGTASPAIHGLNALSALPTADATPHRSAPVEPAPEPGAVAAPVPAPSAAPELDSQQLASLADDFSIPELEPTFLRTKNAQLSAGMRIALWAACAVLAPALLVQLALLFRTSLIVHFPDLQPTLAALCGPLECSAQWPMRPELLAIVSSDLQALPGSTAMEFDAVIRNRAEFPMALPAVELTLTDSLNHPLVRKVFTPSDYLSPHTAAELEASDNLAAGSDLTIRLVFEFRGVGVAGFVAYPFYP